MARQDLHGQDRREQPGRPPRPLPPGHLPGQPPGPGHPAPHRDRPTGAAGGSGRTRKSPRRTRPAPSRPRTFPTAGPPSSPPSPPQRVWRPGSSRRRSRSARAIEQPVGRVVDAHLALGQPGEAEPPEVVPEREPAGRSDSPRKAISPIENWVASPPTGIRPPRPIGQSQASTPASISESGRAMSPRQPPSNPTLRHVADPPAFDQEFDHFWRKFLQSRGNSKWPTSNPDRKPSESDRPHKSLLCQGLA